ncbi:MAG: hypothetical protein JXA90_06450, partial [Planctomycetes bacterium]|nr:hypothetical protein [Planctomycetota bacterium]
MTTIRLPGPFHLAGTVNIGSILLAAILLSVPPPARAATWQYCVLLEPSGGPAKGGGDEASQSAPKNGAPEKPAEEQPSPENTALKPRAPEAASPAEPGQKARQRASSEPRRAYLWLPPASKGIRGALVGGKLGIELELALDPAVRNACAECDLAIVYFAPHIDATFHYWEEGSTASLRWLEAMTALARASGHAELAQVPWITMGHSTAGIFCRNVAYRWPERVAGVIHIKSGNIHQAQHLPPEGSLAGVPLLAMNGQFETFGPEGGLRPELGRETQWVLVLDDLQRLRRKDPRHLASLWIDLGADHFHGSPALAEYAALFIRKTARYRIPAAPPAPGSGEPVSCLPVALEDGWLADGNLREPAAEPAPYAAFKGDQSAALWHYDEEIARAAARHHAKLEAHQCLSTPSLTWAGEDGWTLRAAAAFLDALPPEYGGSAGGKPCGRAAGPIVYHGKPGEPVEQTGPDTFRVLRPARDIHIAAASPGDERVRPTIRWGTIKIPPTEPQAGQVVLSQMIEFPSPPDLPAAGGSAALAARASSGLPVAY